MKRFASHYLFLPEYGFLKQYIVEMNNAGVITCITPLICEQESVSWLPGIIVFVPKKMAIVEIPLFITHCIREKQILLKDISTLSLFPSNYFSDKTAVYLYPFDFDNMQPLVNTKYQDIIAS